MPTGFTGYSHITAGCRGKDLAEFDSFRTGKIGLGTANVLAASDTNGVMARRAAALVGLLQCWNCVIISENSNDVVETSWLYCGLVTATGNDSHGSSFHPGSAWAVKDVTPHGTVADRCGLYFDFSLSIFAHRM